MYIRRKTGEQMRDIDRSSQKSLEVIVQQLQKEIAETVFALDQSGIAIANPYMRTSDKAPAMSAELKSAVMSHVSTAMDEVQRSFGGSPQADSMHQRLAPLVDDAIGVGALRSLYQRSRPDTPGAIDEKSCEMASLLPVTHIHAIEKSLTKWFDLSSGAVGRWPDSLKPFGQIYFALGSQYYDDEARRIKMYLRRVNYLLEAHADGTPIERITAAMLYGLTHDNASLAELVGRTPDQSKVKELLDSQARSHRFHKAATLGGTAALGAGLVASPAVAAPLSGPAAIPVLGNMNVYTIPSDLTTGTTSASQIALNKQALSITIPDIKSDATVNRPVKETSANPAAAADIPDIKSDATVNHPAAKAKHKEVPQRGDQKSPETVKIGEKVKRAGIDAAAKRILKDAEKSVKPLKETNPILARKLTELIASYRQHITEMPPDDDQGKYARIFVARLSAALKNPATLDSIEKDEYVSMFNAYGADFAPLMPQVANEIYVQYNTLQLDEWRGLSEAQLRRLITMMSYINLATTPQNEINAMLRDFQESPKQEAQDNTPETKSPISMVDIVNRAADMYEWSSDKRMFYQAAAELGLSKVMMAGIGGNADIESAGYDMTIEEMGITEQVLNKRSAQNPGIPRWALKGKGYFQWTFDRHVALANQATQQGVDLSSHTVKNAKFQLDHAISEIKKRAPRDGTAQYATEWDLFQALARKGDVKELVWQFQYNFERPAYEQPHSARINAGVKVFNQLKAAEKELTADSNSIDQILNPPELRNVAECAPGTVRVGFVKTARFPDGFELCAVLSLPSSSEESNPNSKWYVEGAEGHGIIQAKYSAALVKLVEAAIAGGIDLRLNSSYRTNAHQTDLWNQNPNPEYVAPPSGYIYKNGEKALGSFHENALALDFAMKGAGDSRSCVIQSGICTQPGDKVWEWLVANAPKYGFEQYSKEAWHWEPAAIRA